MSNPFKRQRAVPTLHLVLPHAGLWRLWKPTLGRLEHLPVDNRTDQGVGVGCRCCLGLACLQV